MQSPKEANLDFQGKGEINSFFSRGLLAAMFAFACCTSPSYSAGNFEFVVKGQEGLKLVVVGFSTSGAMIFNDMVTKPEKRNGSLAYVLRVDENVLKQDNLGLWCVYDVTEKWNLLPNGRKQIALCNDNPFENRGSFQFEPRLEKSKAIVAEALAALSGRISGKQASSSAMKNTFDFKIGKDVPEYQAKTIQDGLDIAQAHINKKYGGAIPLSIQEKIKIKIVATGKGNQEEGGGGAPATALIASGPRLFFDVAHEQWDQDASGRGWTRETDNMKVAVHEYVHGWQSWLGAISFHRQPLGNWINEGLAEYIAYDAMIDAGKIRERDADQFMIDAARQSNEASMPLSKYTSGGPWSGHVGYVAIDWLVAESPNGPMSLRILATEIKAGKSTKRAFLTAFGIELAEFYKQFEGYRAIINANSPEQALSLRPTLKNMSKDGVNSAEEVTSNKKAEVSDDYEIKVIIDRNASFEVMALDKKDRPVWKSGKMGAKSNSFIAKIPRTKIKNASKFCVLLGKGWIVRDQSGKAFSASCDNLLSVAVGVRGISYELKVERQ